MRSPKVGKPRVAQQSLSLSRKLPRLSLPALPSSAARPHPRVGRPPRPIAASLTKKQPR